MTVHALDSFHVILDFECDLQSKFGINFILTVHTLGREELFVGLLISKTCMNMTNSDWRRQGQSMTQNEARFMFWLYKIVLLFSPIIHQFLVVNFLNSCPDTIRSVVGHLYEFEVLMTLHPLCTTNQSWLKDGKK